MFKKINAKLECHIVGAHALPHKISTFIYFFIYIYIYID